MKNVLPTALLLMSASASLASGAATSVTVTETSLATKNDSTVVGYTVVELVIPRLGADRVLAEAFLDLRLDAASALGDALSGGLATVEIAKMPALVNGRLDAENVQPVMKRTVKVGDDRAVRLYITSLVRAELELLGNGQDQLELTLLIGSIEGRRYGRFEAQAVLGASGAKATLTVRTRERYDPNGAE